MNNNTETIEQAAHRILTEFGIKSIGDNINAHSVQDLMILMANWQQREQQLMPVIKEMIEALKEARMFIPIEFKTLHNDIQTTLDKYKNYL
jgi:hypothetical protein